MLSNNSEALSSIPGIQTAVPWPPHTWYGTCTNKIIFKGRIKQKLYKKQNNFSTYAFVQNSDKCTRVIDIWLCVSSMLPISV